MKIFTALSLLKVQFTDSGNNNRKDFAIIIDNLGQLKIKRKKSENNGPLLSPSISERGDIKVGILLCCEAFIDDIELSNADIIFNPIGTGMFSNEQFSEWINKAKELAVKNKSIILGASHSDGSYKNCGVSIPIVYIIDSEGTEILISKDDTRTIIFDSESKEAYYI